MGRKKTAGPQAPKMVRVPVAAHELGLLPFTVRRWIKQRKIQAVRVGLEARIPRAEIERLVGSTNERVLVLYGRVSGQGQRDDLTTQLARLEQRADTQRPGQPRVTLSDRVSGLSTGRKLLQHQLMMVCEDRLGEVAITYADRYTRFGHAYLECLFDSFGVTLTILEPEEDKTPEQEWTADLLSVIASFSGRMYGMGSHNQKELVTCAQAEITSP